MRLGTILPLIVGLGAGVVAVWIGLRAINQAKLSNKPSDAVTVMVANAEIPYAAEIKAEMLVAKSFGTFPLEGKFGKTDELVGRVACTRIVKNTPVLVSMLAEEGTLPGVENQIPMGFRAEPVLVQAYTAEGLDPGNRVDVLYSAKSLTGGRLSGPRVFTPILQNIAVFSVGDRRMGMEEPEAVKKKGSARGSAATPVKGDVPVKLLVRVEDVTTLQAAAMNGTLQLSVRAAGDDTIYEMPDSREMFSAEVVEAEAAKDTSVLMVPRYHTVKIFDSKGAREETFPMGTQPADEEEGGDKSADEFGSERRRQPEGDPD